MSCEPAIRLRGVSKRFDIYDKPHHRLAEMLGGKRRAREFWAVRDIDLDVARGETVGIVGRNGSGKSTLLQMICGTLEPTSGAITCTGRVAALLELGAGFNPEFSGLENVRLNATLLGMSSAEIDARLDRILDFAAIGDFVHQPVRTYSSGMYVRLAFAVAVSIDPDVLVVDEALAVGDEAFQRKCFARIEELKRAGTSILFVSHSAGAVVQLCDRAMLMDGGRRLLEGRPKAVIAQYQRLAYAGAAREAEVIEQILAMGDAHELDSPEAAHDAPDPDRSGAGAGAGRPPSRSARFDPGLVSASRVEYPSQGARILDPWIEDEGGQRVNVLVPGRAYRYRYRVEFDRDCRGVFFGMLIKSITGVELAGVSTHPHGQSIASVERGSRVEVAFSFRASLLPGTYFMNAGCSGADDAGEGTFLHRVLDALMFRVECPEDDRRVTGFIDLFTGSEYQQADQERR